MDKVAEALGKAVAAGRLDVALQGKVSLRDGMPAGFEALVRWPGSERDAGRPVGPEEFVPVAEEAGLAPEIDMFVVRKVCSALAGMVATPSGARLAECVGSGLVAVNVSAATLSDPSWAARFLSVPKGFGLDASVLQVEVTETAVLRDPAAARANLAAVHAAGVGIALDDFGVGHSGLRRLKEFPIDEVKVDRSFLAGIARPCSWVNSCSACVGHGGGEACERAYGILEWIVGVGKVAGGIRVVVEGVEDEWQAAAVRGMGADVGQGWRWSRPIAPDAAFAEAATLLETALTPVD